MTTITEVAQDALQSMRDAARVLSDLPPLPPIDPKDRIPYESIRYIPGYVEGYVQQYAQAYAREAIAHYLKQHEGLAAGEVVMAQCQYATVEWRGQTSTRGNGDPKNSYSWPVTGDKVFLAPQPQEASPEELAKRVWQAIECPICGGGAQAFPQPQAIEAAVMAERAACRALCKELADNEENTAEYRAGAAWCEERIRARTTETVTTGFRQRDPDPTGETP